MLTRLNPFFSDVDYVLFDGFFKDYSSHKSYDSYVEDDGFLCFSVDVPGIKDEDINISLHNNVVSVSAERKTKNSSYSVSKKFTVPRNFDSASVNAELKDGVLSLRFAPKPQEQAEVKKIPITVK